ncbi:MAG: hypothetical protein V7L11_26880 [Nostoc sp.]|uniref:hypothetical protein n=1 Tax=Nostoc sp. TaxID=1180 RepID=UPI002FF98A39
MFLEVSKYVQNILDLSSKCDLITNLLSASGFSGFEDGQDYEELQIIARSGCMVSFGFWRSPAKSIA